MTSWALGAICNAVISLAYFLIVGAIVVPLMRSRQLRSNPLGAATAAIFFTCAVHHGAHTVHMVLPSMGLSDPQGLAMREAWGWPLALWDLVGAFVGIYYWTLRRHYSSLMEGAKLFEDMRQRERQALELNDNVLQGLVVARMALDVGQPEKAQDALETTIRSASEIITGLLGPGRIDGSLMRQQAAELPHHGGPAAAAGDAGGGLAAAPGPRHRAPGEG